MPSMTQSKAAFTVRRQAVSATQQATAHTWPVTSTTSTRMPPHASTRFPRSTTLPSRFQNTATLSSVADSTITSSMASSGLGLCSLRSLDSSVQSAETGFHAPPPTIDLAVARAARSSRFQRSATPSVASDSTSGSDSQCTASIRSATASSASGKNSRFSTSQRSDTASSASGSTSTSSTRSSWYIPLSISDSTRQSVDTGIHAPPPSLASVQVPSEATRFVAKYVAEDWTINSNFSITEKKKPLTYGTIPDEVHLPARYDNEYFVDLEGQKITADCRLHATQQRLAVTYRKLIEQGECPKRFNAESQADLKRQMVITIEEITKIDDAVVKGQVTNCYLDYVETAYDFAKPLPEDAEISTAFKNKEADAFRTPCVEDAEQLIELMSQGVEKAFPVFRQWMMKRQEAFLANATYKILTMAAETRPKLRARLEWERTGKLVRLPVPCCEEEPVPEEQLMPSAAASKPRRKRQPPVIECPMLDSNNPPKRPETYSLEELAATKKEDGLMTRWLRKLGACWGEEGMSFAQIFSWRERKWDAQIRNEQRLYIAWEKKHGRPFPHATGIRPSAPYRPFRIVRGPVPSKGEAQAILKRNSHVDEETCSETSDEDLESEVSEQEQQEEDQDNTSTSSSLSQRFATWSSLKFAGLMNFLGIQ